MKKKLMILCIALSLALAAPSFAAPTIIDLDGDEFTGVSGNYTYTTPPLGSIKFDGEIMTPGLWVDTEMVTAGSTGNVFDVIAANTWVTLTFDFSDGFQVTDVSFIYGGNADRIIIEAWDDSSIPIMLASLDASTGNGASAGPVTWYAGSGNSIKTLRWKDPGGSNPELLYNFAALDNISITVIPAPGAILLGSIGVGFVGWLRRRRTL
ncbi:MAG: hypothetical protein H8D56_26680 [Planctomycetes bacterium]|nr:hypothetical protein [Planctomycetota bacterium]MBL7143937.1 hypothetical protein [Phycisphaerae bacterium]